jgi:hypothetical protein
MHSHPHGGRTSLTVVQPLRGNGYPMMTVRWDGYHAMITTLALPQSDMTSRISLDRARHPP